MPDHFKAARKRSDDTLRAAVALFRKNPSAQAFVCLELAMESYQADRKGARGGWDQADELRSLAADKVASLIDERQVADGHARATAGHKVTP